MMRKITDKLLVPLIVTVLSSFVVVQAALAVPITGSQALSGIGVTANTGDIETATSVDILSFIISSSTGDFLSGPAAGTTLNDTTPVTLNIPAAPGALSPNFVISEGIWGTFTGTSLTLDDNGPVNGRNIYLLGTFVPNSPNFPATLTSNSASLQLAFTQQGGVGNSISVSASLNTPAVPPPGDGGTVPEPGTVLLLGSGIVGLWLARFRKQSR